MNTQEELNASEVLNASEKRVFDSFQDAKAYLKNTSNLNQKYYKRKDKLIILSKKISRGMYSEEQEHFSKNELRIMETYIDTHDELKNGLDCAIYDYIVEIIDKNKNICLCEIGECCRKCCIHPGTTCIWKNYVEADEWNDPDSVWFGSFRHLQI